MPNSRFHKIAPSSPLLPVLIDFVTYPPKWVGLAENNMIEWYGVAEGKFIRRGPKCLYNFVDLVGQPPEAIKKFVEKWGPLAITPEIIEDVRVADEVQASSYKIMPEGTKTYTDSFNHVFREPIQVYYEYAQYAASLLNIAAATSDDKIPNKKDRDIVFSNYQTNFRQWDIHRYRDALAEQVGLWLSTAGVYPVPVWTHGQYVLTLSYTPNPLHTRGWDMAQENGTPFCWQKINTKSKCIEPVIAPRPSSLFAVLAIELTKRIMHPEGLKKCTRCPILFNVTHGRQLYCETCKADAKREQNNKWARNNKKQS